MILKAVVGAASTLSPGFAVNPAPASQLAFSTQPGGTVAEGATFTTQPALSAQDAFNNPDSFTSPVTLQVADYVAGNGGSTQGVITNCTNPVTPVGGVATFAGCQITGSAAAGTYTFKAAGGGLTSANSTGTVTITSGAASRTDLQHPALRHHW